MASEKDISLIFNQEVNNKTNLHRGLTASLQKNSVELVSHAKYQGVRRQTA